jgi:cytochrome bd-type quinol oxidase subunit 2
MAFMSLGHFPLLFGIGGSLILLLFLGSAWLWAKERAALEGSAAAAADLKLVGYIFLLIAVWFTCGALSWPFLKAFEGQEPSTPLHIMLFFVLGWLFLFLSHYRSRKPKEGSGEAIAAETPEET